MGPCTLRGGGTPEGVKGVNYHYSRCSSLSGSDYRKSRVG